MDFKNANETLQIALKLLAQVRTVSKMCKKAFHLCLKLLVPMLEKVFMHTYLTSDIGSTLLLTSVKFVKCHRYISYSSPFKLAIVLEEAN